MAEAEKKNRGLGWGVLSWPDYFRQPHELVAAVAYAFLVLLLLAVLAIAVSLLLRVLFAAFGPENLDPIKSADDFNKILLGLGGLIGAVTAVPFLVWRTMIAQKQNVLAQENIHSTTMAKAIEQLGATREEKTTEAKRGEDGTITQETVTNSKPNIEVRLGAIYLLEKLAREHEQLHWPIMEILCAYIRRNCDKLSPPSVEVQIAYATMNIDEDEHNFILNRQIDSPRVDIQAAINVIGRRSEQQRSWELKLREKSQDKLSYRFDLNSCQLAKMTFRGLNFEYAIFDNCCFERSSFINVILSNAEMKNIHFEGGYIIDSDLSNANLNWAFLHGATIEKNIAYNTSFISVIMAGAKINREIFNQSTIDFLDLRFANLAGNKSMRFTGYDVKLSCSLIQLTEFYNSNFSEMDFSGANMSRAKFNDSSFKGADFSDALLDNSDLSSARFLTAELIELAWGNSETKLPNGINRPINDRWALNSNYDEERQKRWLLARHRLIERIKNSYLYE
jgi:uncharacterized protein YjbI with pentapeptide repeats